MSEMYKRWESENIKATSNVNHEGWWAKKGWNAAVDQAEILVKDFLQGTYTKQELLRELDDLRNKD